FGLEAFDNVGVLSGYVDLLSDVVAQVVELRRIDVALLIRNGEAITSTRLSVQRAIRVRQLQLPTSVPARDGLEIVGLIIEIISAMRIFGTRLTREDRPDI